jgi:predicted Zn-dependent protease with MMP-like domain
MKLTWEELCGVAEEEVTRLMAGLPGVLRERAEMVPVILEPRPSEEMQVDGIEEDTLGLFIGPEWAEEGEVPMPPQIILYLENLRDLSETDGKRFRDEIKTTFLHELGHFLGLNEEDLGERGLE